MAVKDGVRVAFIEGDGIGPEIFRAAREVLDASVEATYGGRRTLVWEEVLAGEKAHRRLGVWLPEETLGKIEEVGVALKGPLTTPVGGGIRSLNVAIRQALDLYACIRPVKHIPGVPSPLRNPQHVDMVVFRENSEDLYSGIEFASGAEGTHRLMGFIKESFQRDLSEDAALALKVITPFACKRLVRKAMEYALENGYSSVTLMHKGNILKETEGAFLRWGYEVIEEEFGDKVVFERDLHGGPPPQGKVLVRDRLADSMFQQVLLRPMEYHIIATTNLNGDYLSDSLAAAVGGLGLAPGANMGERTAVFEATHGSAPKYAGKDRVNPTSLILSGVLMLRHIGWGEAAERIEEGLQGVIAHKIVTYDLARQMKGAKEVTCSQFARALIERIFSI